MSQFNGTWECIERQGDEHILKLMGVPDKLVGTYLTENYDPTYRFNFKGRFNFCAL